MFECHWIPRGYHLDLGGRLDELLEGKKTPLRLKYEMQEEVR